MGDIILEKEDVFLLNLYEKLNNKFSIIKAKNKYCSVDMLLTNPINLKTLYIEHKFRNIVDKYDTLFIGKTKVENINLFYKNCIIVWEFQNGVFYYFEANDSMITTYNSSFIRGSLALEIKKEDCGKTLDSLLNVIIKKLD